MIVVHIRFEKTEGRIVILFWCFFSKGIAGQARNDGTEAIKASTDSLPFFTIPPRTPNRHRRWHAPRTFLRTVSTCCQYHHSPRPQHLENPVNFRWIAVVGAYL